MYNERIVRLELLEDNIISELISHCNNKLCINVTLLSITVVAIVLAISVIVYRHLGDIRYAFEKPFRRDINNSKGGYLDQELPYDAFIAYDKDDVMFVKEHLVPQLESPDSEDCALKLAIHQRDFVIGRRIDENIMQAIGDSRKTVLVLSRSFLNSDWCNYEVEIASVKCLEAGQDLIVCVVLEHLPTSEMSRNLQNIMRKSTYLEMPEDQADLPIFWKRLRMALAPPANHTLSQSTLTMNRPSDYADMVYNALELLDDEKVTKKLKEILVSSLQEQILEQKEEVSKLKKRVAHLEAFKHAQKIKSHSTSLQ